MQLTISNLLEDLNPRQKNVLGRRFALDGKSKAGLTLAELGKKYGVTRERIRQIEEAAFASVRKKIQAGAGKPVFTFVKSHMDKMGGVSREDVLLKEISAEFGAGLTPLQLHFLLEANDGYGFHSGDKDFYPFWLSDQKMFQLSKALIEKIYRHLKEKKADVLREKNFNEVFPFLAKELNVPENVSRNYLAISKKFGVNHYGDFGLSEWAEINPKTVRDRAYLVLKNVEKPLHFRDIATHIKDRKFDEKNVHASTVHNELIKDGRFVLVGRGIYALAEHGYQPGTAREVIARILKSSGPLDIDNLVQLVLKERFFKQNTVMLNLQNKKLFRKLPDGRYNINQA
ncbi:MAG TPA: sigma factor-like helix-turn-helix DNA-binding protein [Candidatus Paceibacterota bacterium]